MKKHYNIAGLKFKILGEEIIALQTLEHAELIEKIQMKSIYDINRPVFKINKIKIHCVGCFAIDNFESRIYLPGNSIRLMSDIKTSFDRKDILHFLQ